MIKKIFVILILFFVAKPCYAIKIGLITDSKKVVVGTSVAGKIIDTKTNTTVYDLEKMKAYEIANIDNSIAIKINGRYTPISANEIVIRPMESGFVSAKRLWYRGVLRLKAEDKNLIVVNDVPIEDYLKGVVSKEMIPSWEKEALKAQAIAARSYTIANMGKRATLGFDLNDTTEDQAYGGASAETKKTNTAVEDTKGIVLTHNERIIKAFYFASAGGKTRNSIWGRDLPYLHSVPSFDDEIGKKGHGVGMSQYGANYLAKKGHDAYQILSYFYNNVGFARTNPQVYH